MIDIGAPPANRRVTRLALVLAVLAALLGIPAHASALGDVTPPDSMANPPPLATGPSFDIPYSASDDAGGSGLARVDLYARAPGDLTYSLADSDTTPDTASFTYTPAAGDGQYGFYTVAVDNDGNAELPPLNDDGVTTVDSAPPASAASAPAAAGPGAIPVTYSADDPGGSGVASVELWARAPGDTTFAPAGTDNSPESPSFDYTPAAGDGSYSFYTVAIDAAGNRETAPSAPDAATAVDATAPSSSASAPGSVGTGPIAITYTANDGSGSGVASVELWARAPAATTFGLAGTDSSPDSPSFTYTPAAGDGTYSFYTVAVDATSNREPAPASPDASTTRDTAAHAPAPSTAPPPSSPPPSGGVVLVQLPADQPASGGTGTEQSSAAPAAPSLPLVAAVTFLGKQTLRSATIDGIRLRVYAYQPVKLGVQAALDQRTAKRLGLRRRPLLAKRSYDFQRPGVYMVRLRLAHRAVTRLRDVLAATFVLRTVLTAAGGTATSNSTLQLRR